MKKSLTIILTFLISNISFSQVDEDSSEKTTKSLFEIQVNAEKYILEEGDELNIDGKLKNPKIKVQLLDIKKFNNQSISFDYPNNFSYEIEKSLGYRNWTLDGNDFIIMIFEIAGKVKVSDIINDMMLQFGEENCNSKNIETTLGNKTINGIQLSVNVVQQKIKIDYYEISASETTSVFIAFQDILDDDGQSSEESEFTINLINKTIKYN